MHWGRGKGKGEGGRGRGKGKGEGGRGKGEGEGGGGMDGAVARAPSDSSSILERGVICEFGFVVAGSQQQLTQKQQQQ